MTAVSFSDLEVYQRSYRTSLDMIRKIIPRLPSEEKFNLIDQIRRSSMAIPALIAEGYAKKHQQSNWKKYLTDNAKVRNLTQRNRKITCFKCNQENIVTAYYVRCRYCQTPFTKCEICQLSIKEKQDVSVCTSCNHTFHINHWNQWIRSRSKCPICKYAYETPALVTKGIPH